jgi:hypothetical protein
METNMNRRRSRPWHALALLAALALPAAAQDGAAPADTGDAPLTLEEARITLGKWIETQQIIGRERKDWQQGKEILQGRLELVKKEQGGLQEGVAQAQASVTEATRKRDELLAEQARLQAAQGKLAEAVTALEARVRKLLASVPEPLRVKLDLLRQRIPEDPATTRISVAERFQNVLGILNELNAANNDVSVGYEVHELADGKPAEVRVLYIGLAQAWYVSAGGEAGIGRATPDGWVWEPSKSIAPDVLSALEIREGKQSPAFVPLPVQLQ